MVSAFVRDIFFINRTIEKIEKQDDIKGRWYYLPIICMAQEVGSIEAHCKGNCLGEDSN